MLKIPRVSRQKIQVQKWQLYYQPHLSISEFKYDTRYFRLTLISGDEKACVLVRVNEWCHYRWPLLGDYAWEALDDINLIDLMSSEYDEEILFFGTFKCKFIEVIKDCCSQQYWLSVQEEYLGKTLLESPIEPLIKQSIKNKVWSNLALQIDWVWGYSMISAALLNSIELGDVLCIQYLQPQICIERRPIARFQKQQKGQFMIDEMIDMPPEDCESKYQEDFVDDVLMNFDMKSISVKLTFVLGQSEISVAELADIQPGMVYSIGENKEREVKVYANKQLIAQGELVYIGNGEELGLEINRMASLGD
ncbi:FliM/FliN family flagellar motor switch protein [Providencia sneebia]|uniref:Type III secretion apparatus protein n=1 Tax=Providencia sneebia DSM 19967 TaxID=1141660 RepID=K8WXH9_9GAMM|nr:type III secretion apparatus protein [Providencia sneebia DSM 19967]